MDLLTSLRKATALDRLAELEVEDARVYADRAQALVDVEDVCLAQPDADRAMEFIALDIATASGCAQNTATARLTKAKHLVQDLPLTHTALRQGRLLVGQAIALMEETTDLTREVCSLVEQKALPRIEGATCGDTRRLVKRIVVQVDADASEARRQAKIAARRAWNSPRPDGRALIGVEASAEDARAYWRALTEIAKAVQTPADTRTLDQLRADIAMALPHFALSHLDQPSSSDAEPAGGPDLRTFLASLGIGHAPDAADTTDATDATDAAGAGDAAGATGSGAARSSAMARRRERRAKRIQAVVLVPVETGLDLTDNPGHLVDYGPITAHHARDLLAAAELRHACTDLLTGRLVALQDTLLQPRSSTWRPSTLQAHLLAMVHSSTPVEDRIEQGHDPSPGLADFLRLRDDRCVGPGCSHPAHGCDLEHLDPHPEGTTSADNLGPASRRCHNAKTHGGWTLQPHPDGSVTWTSPLGRHHTRPSRTQPTDLSNLHPPPNRQRRPPTSAPKNGDGEEGSPHGHGSDDITE